jgi:hypothetical protein
MSSARKLRSLDGSAQSPSRAIKQAKSGWILRLRELGINSFLTKVALPSAILGFILIRIYFWQVEYVSTLQFKDLFSTGVLAFVLVGAMIASLVACLLVPTFFLFEIVLDLKPARILELLRISNIENEDQRKENAKNAALFCSITLLFPWLLASSLILTVADQSGHAIIDWSGYKTAYLFVNFGYFSYLFKDQKTKFLVQLGQFFLLLVPCLPLVYVAFAFVPLLHFSSLSDAELTPLHVFGYFAVFGFLVAFINFVLLAALRTGKKIEFWSAAIAASFIAIVLMCILLGSTGRLNFRLMELASIRVPNLSLVLNSDGCALLKARGFLQDDEIPYIASAAAGECLVHGVNALVAVSSDWCVECGPLLLAEKNNERQKNAVGVRALPSQCAFSLSGKSILNISKNTLLLKPFKKP